MIPGCAARARAVGIAAALALAAPAPARAEESLDSGGAILRYAGEIDRLNAAGAAKALTGVCASACTMYLGVRRVCVDPDAEFWFHAAHLPDSDAPDPEGSLVMLSYYPGAVRAWAIRVGALVRTQWDARAMLSGRQVIRMGVPRCRG